ncbi:MAG: rhodanese-like domain-containing protein [Bacteroidia bacterium]|nr:rhodanese-like domain-containing protein [Bacteroidia bacterium]
MKNYPELIATGKATIVDVRSPEEFEAGHLENSINVPLHEIPVRMDELRKMNNIVLCCASGTRSRHATNVLQKEGISCENGGSWIDLNLYLQTKTV